MKKILLLMTTLIVVTLFGCSSTNTFEMSIKGKEVNLEELQVLCFDCQNLNTKFYDYVNEISRLRAKIKEINNFLYANYGPSPSFDVINKYLSGPNVELNDKINEFNGFKDNKCYKFLYSLGDDSKIYIFVNLPNYLKEIEGEYYNSINKLTIILPFNLELEFNPVITPMISSYNSNTNWLHLYCPIESQSEIEILKKDKPNDVIIKYNTNIEKNGIIN